MSNAARSMRPVANRRNKKARSEKTIIIVALIVVGCLALRLEVALLWSNVHDGISSNNNNNCAFGRCSRHHQELQQKLSSVYGFCDFPVGDRSNSASTLKNALLGRMLKRTTRHLVQEVYGYNATAEEMVAPALAEIAGLFSEERIRKGLMNPMPSSSSDRLVEIIKNRLKDPETYPPLQIMVFGGSIVAGREGSRFTNDGVAIYRGNETAARWSTQLEMLLNEVMFGGNNVVKVTNMAVPGVTTDVASVLLKYTLWPEGYPKEGPDLIIASFGFNDVFKFVSKDDLGSDRGYMEILSASQKFIRAALGLSRCDELPALMFVDDSFLIGHISVRDNLAHSRALAELSTWYDVMTVSYTKAFLHYSYKDSRLHNVSKSYKSRYLLKDAVTVWPLFGGVLPTYHPQIMYHSGIAWLLFFEIFQTFEDSCEDTTAGITNQLLGSDQFHGLSTRQIPELKENLFFQEVPLPWMEATKRYDASCSDNNFQPGNACSFLWIASKVTAIRDGNDVNAILKTVEIANDGWVGEGLPVRPPRPGYVANKSGASFTISVHAAKNPIRKVTLIYMKSYGEKWNTSRLAVNFRTMRGNVMIAETSGELEGFHDSETSVNYDAFFDVAAEVGDRVEAKFDVVGGAIFKITGMLFCVK